MGITITRALRELTTIQHRITKEISGMQMLDVTQKRYGDRCLTTNLTELEFCNKVKSSFDSLQGLLLRRRKLKAGLMRTNVLTSITFNGESKTIAEVIDEKEMLKYIQAITNKMQNERSEINRKVENNRTTLNQQVDNLVTQSMGKDRKCSKEDYAAIADPLVDANKLNLIDPIGIDKEIDKHKAKITAILDELDITLSEVNARTEIILE